mgnify:CR=1 FL=1
MDACCSGCFQAYEPCWKMLPEWLRWLCVIIAIIVIIFIIVALNKKKKSGSSGTNAAQIKAQRLPEEGVRSAVRWLSQTVKAGMLT